MFFFILTQRFNSEELDPRMSSCLPSTNICRGFIIESDEAELHEHGKSIGSKKILKGWVTGINTVTLLFSLSYSLVAMSCPCY
jgi:hypothetical protein